MSGWPLPPVLAHRCGGALAPENTLAGLNAAHATGCAGVEFDVMLSGSGSPVLIHDETLERTTDGTGRVAETTDEALNRLDAGSWFAERFAGEHLPFLWEAAARCRALGLAVNLEIKPSAGLETATGLEAARWAAELWAGAPLPPLLSSFSEPALQAAAEAAPHLRRGLLVEDVPADWQDRCRRLGVVALHAEARRLRYRDVKAARKAGLWVVAYTVNDARRAETLFRWGVECVITDRPDAVRRDPAEGADRDEEARGEPGAAS